MSPTAPPALFLLGAAVGAFGTLIGAGGGFLLLPLLMVLSSNPPASLASVSLAVVALNALSGTIAYAWRKRIDYRLAAVLGAVSMPTAGVGALLTARLTRPTFDAMFGLLLLVLAAVLLLRPRARRSGRGPAVDGREAGHRASTSVMGLAATAVVGFLSGLIGIGGSPLQVVVLTHVLGVPAQSAMPTAQFMVLLSALAGLAVHAATGHFQADVASLAPLGLGALLGAQFGASLAERVSEGRLIRLLALALLTLGVRLLSAAL